MGELLKLQYEIRDLKQELEIRINDNADLYAKLCNALMQLNEAEYYLKELPYGLDSYKKYAEKWKIVNK